MTHAKYLEDIDNEGGSQKSVRTQPQSLANSVNVPPPKKGEKREHDPDVEPNGECYQHDIAFLNTSQWCGTGSGCEDKVDVSELKYNHLLWWANPYPNVEFPWGDDSNDDGKDQLI